MCSWTAGPVRARSPSPPTGHCSTMEIATPLLEMGFTWPHIRNAILSTGVPTALILLFFSLSKTSRVNVAVILTQPQLNLGTGLR